MKEEVEMLKGKIINQDEFFKTNEEIKEDEKNSKTKNMHFSFFYTKRFHV